MTGYLPREITPRLARARRQLPVVVLSGLRQSGKSTLLQNETVLIQGHVYRTLDDYATLAAARSNPESLLAEPAILDEVQRCPELLVALKKNIDEHRRPGRFILSGSANLALLGHVSETLAGRAAYLTLYPMTRREIRGETGDRPFLADFLASPEAPRGRARPVTEDEALTGGLPPAALNPAGDVAEWFRGYVQTYVERGCAAVVAGWRLGGLPQSGATRRSAHGSDARNEFARPRRATQCCHRFTVPGSSGGVVSHPSPAGLPPQPQFPSCEVTEAAFH